MAYQQGDTITASDYNSFIGDINTVIGTGSGDSGYGLTEISTVAAGATITAAQWNSLLSGLQTAANHQGSTITNASNTVSTGGNILPLSNLGTDITTINTNRLTAAGGNLSTGIAGVTSTRTTAWTGTVTHAFTVAFASANAARYFFNSGGRITMAFSRSGGSTTDQNTSWTNLLSGIGSVSFGPSDTTATAGGTAIGFHDLTGSAQTFLTSDVGSGDYAANDLTGTATYDSAGTITFTLNFNDDHAAETGTYTGGGLGSAPNEGTGWTGTDSVDGTLTSTITFTKADNASYVQVANPTFTTTTGL
jgi:hypothetical protein